MEAGCMQRWGGSCSSNDDCCGILLCQYDNQWWSSCQHPIDYCKSFSTSNCPSGDCKVESGSCKPANDYYHTALSSGSSSSSSGSDTTNAASPTPSPTSVGCASPATFAPVAFGTTTETNVVWTDTDESSWCAEVNNLGYGYSESQGYQGEYPALGPTPSSGAGYDDTVAVLIGGSYYAPNSAEIEGKTVVLGDFIIGSAGTNSIGT